jgi:hypothetical protein
MLNQLIYANGAPPPLPFGALRQSLPMAEFEAAHHQLLTDGFYWTAPDKV